MRWVGHAERACDRDERRTGRALIVYVTEKREPTRVRESETKLLAVSARESETDDETERGDAAVWRKGDKQKERERKKEREIERRRKRGREI